MASLKIIMEFTLIINKLKNNNSCKNLTSNNRPNNKVIIKILSVKILKKHF